MNKKDTTLNVEEESIIVPDDVNAGETIPAKGNVLEEMQKQLAALKKQNDMLLQVADKKALARFYDRNQDEVPKEVKLRTINGKVIVGWRTTKDEVYKDSHTGFYKEIQEVEVLYEDKTTEAMALTDFNRKYEYVNCRRTGILTDEKTKKTAFKLERIDTGKPYVIAVEFVN